MAFDVGAYRLLSYSSAVPPTTRKTTLAAVRKDAKALKKQYQQPAPPPFSLPGLQALLSNVLSWLFPPAPAPTQPTQPPSGKAATFKVSSFNILGSTHTAPGGDAKGYASGVTRIRWAADLLKERGIDVVGFQEMNNDQAAAFKQAASDTFALYPGTGAGGRGGLNSIAWRKDTWKLVKAEMVKMPSHKGEMRNCPVVLLEDKKTGQRAYFLNWHNAPGYHKGGAQQHWRDKATDMQVALLNKLKRESGLPVIVTGDMNEKDTYFRRMTTEAGMQAANQGPGGQKPRIMFIDWIFGTKDVLFKTFKRDRSEAVRRISDHGMLVSKVKID